MKNVVTGIFALLFLTHQAAEATGFHHPFIDSYLDDFLFLPLFLYTVEQIVRLTSRTSFQLSKGQQLIIALQAVIIAEFVFPAFSNRFTFDYWDFAAYLSGYMVYTGILAIFRHDTFETA